MLFFFSKE